MYKRTVEFVDKNHQKFVVEIEITNDGILSMSSESGQGKFEPSTDAQTELLMIWDKWHLNDMHAGNKEQTEYLEKHKSDYEETKKNNVVDSYYDWATRVLNNAGLNTKYKYGSSWIKEKLPIDIKKRINHACDTIEEEEKDRKSEQLDEWSDEQLVAYIEEHCSFVGTRDNELAAAFVRMFNLCMNDLDDIEIDDNRCTVQGIDYLAGTDAEMDDKWDTDLDNYIEECLMPEIKNDNLKRYFDTDAWKSDARMDGRAHNLNRYDGNEEEATINYTNYYSYRQ